MKKGTRLTYNDGNVIKQYTSNGFSDRSYCENVLNLIDDEGNHTSIVYRFADGIINQFISRYIQN